MTSKNWLDFGDDPAHVTSDMCIIIIIIRAFVRRTMSASELNLRRRKFDFITIYFITIVLLLYLDFMLGIISFVMTLVHKCIFIKVLL